MYVDKAKRTHDQITATDKILYLPINRNGSILNYRRNQQIHRGKRLRVSILKNIYIILRWPSCPPSLRQLLFLYSVQILCRFLTFLMSLANGSGARTETGPPLHQLNKWQNRLQYIITVFAPGNIFIALILSQPVREWTVWPLRVNTFWTILKGEPRNSRKWNLLCNICGELLLTLLWNSF